MKYDYDIITIGLGPAGMAVSIMGSEMGLNICAIEKKSLGGECMNAGCIPSKALLRAARTRHTFSTYQNYSLKGGSIPEVDNIFENIQKDLNFIGDKKTKGMFKKTDLMLKEGSAKFVDSHTVAVGDKRITAKRIFICTGTKPFVPPVEGIEDINYLTNENMFKLEKVPQSMIIIGGGVIGCEMAQAYQRLGTKVTIINRDKNLIFPQDAEVATTLKTGLEKDGVTIYNDSNVSKYEKTTVGVKAYFGDSQVIEAEQIIIAAGRVFDPSELDLDKAGVEYTKKGIKVNNILQTNKKHILACGDCNGHFLLSHAAMHQGMIALMNTMVPLPSWMPIPGPFKRNFKQYVVPSTIFTDPQVSRVGLNEDDLQKLGKKYQVVKVNYGDYGAAIAEKVETGYIKAFISPLGKIYGVYIVGEGSGEMINEWALAIQKNLHITSIMLMQHSFPTMGFLTKRVSEEWMMGKMASSFLQKMCQVMFRL